MEEKVYKTMGSTGGGSLAIGICILVTGIVSGILLIVNGARLLKKALCQVLGCDSLNHAPLLDLELFLYLIYFTMILGMANKPSSAHLKIN